MYTLYQSENIYKCKIVLGVVSFNKTHTHLTHDSNIYQIWCQENDTATQ